MKTKLIASIMVAVCIDAHAETTTNEITLDYSANVKLDGFQSTHYKALIPVFLNDAIDWFDIRFYDRLAPFRRGGNLQELPADAADRNIRNAWIGSLVDSGRTMGESFSIWNRMDAVGKTISSSIGPGEELIDPLSPSFQYAEKSWWTEVRKDNDLTLRVDPFNVSPNLSISARWKQGGQTLFYTDLRFSPDHWNWQDEKISLVASIPIFDGVSLVIGASQEFHLNGDNEAPSAVARVEKVLYGKDKIHPSGYAFLSASTKLVAVGAMLSF